MVIRLGRWCYSAHCTRGVLTIGSSEFETVERPWIKGEAPGGLGFQSCIPDGTYSLDPHVRPSGQKSYILSNPNAGVFKFENQIPEEGGRYLILIHPGNSVADVVGCIAPGLSGNDQHVFSSRKAMNQIRALLGDEESHTLVIYPKGTS